jgi:hypothetical protein
MYTNAIEQRVLFNKFYASDEYGYETETLAEYFRRKLNS